MASSSQTSIKLLLLTVLSFTISIYLIEAGSTNSRHRDHGRAPPGLPEMGSCESRGGQCGEVGRCGEGPALNKNATNCNRAKNNQDCCIFLSDKFPKPPGGNGSGSG